MYKYTSKNIIKITVYLYIHILIEFCIIFSVHLHENFHDSKSRIIISE